MRLALAGDTMLGRGVADELRRRPPESLVDPDVVALVRSADLIVLNLECCISEGGRPEHKVFTFRAPPAAAEVLAHLGVDCVTLANNHALDYGPDALLDTFEHLRRVGIRWVGAGADVTEARAAALLEDAGMRLAVRGVTDHPPSWAATDTDPGVAHADLRRGVPEWLTEEAGDADAVLVTPHWGPNMTAEPVGHVRAAAAALRDAGVTLVAGHSAHVFHGVEDNVLYDLGDFVDDYRTDRDLRNDLGLLFLVDLEPKGLTQLEAVPLKLEYAHTRLAEGSDAAWVRRRFCAACAALGTEVSEAAERLVISWHDAAD
jgi:poly-gamma-glutamate capsule biosynthesis protein CapA/YwtB (metallophosphatase superfamily)